MNDRIKSLNDDILKRLSKIIGERIEIEGVKFVKKNYINISQKRLEDYGMYEFIKFLR